jgi:carbon-monoxide dehydrogenase large subunit
MYIGQPIRRREDLRLVRGRGRFVDDVSAPDMAWVSFVRSPYPHARIRSIDKTPAQRMPGIVRVLVAQDWEAAGLGKMASVHPMHFSDGRKMNEAMRPIMARDKVRHVGEVVAAVVGTSRYAAMDGAEAVEVGYEELACVTETSRALDPNAPILHEEFGVNLVNDIIRGDRAATDAAFARAAHITSLTLNSGRVAAMPLEPFAYAAFYDETSELTTLWATIQMPHNLRQWLCKQTLFIPEDKLRVIAPDVGGSFGAKGGFQPEVSIVVWMARELRRPVKWTSTRSEEFLTQTHARDHATKARMAFGRYPCRPRRVYQPVRAQHTREFLPPHHRRPLPYARALAAREVGLHEYLAHGTLSRVGASGGDLGCRAFVRERRPGNGPGRRRDATAQSHSKTSVPVCDGRRASA